MVRDIDHRLTEFGCQVEIHKIALTIDQVESHTLPPNPAKMSDPRAAAYVERHGDESWELDALPPSELNTLVTESIGEYLDRQLFDEVIEREEADKKRLTEFKEQVGK